MLLLLWDFGKGTFMSLQFVLGPSGSGKSSYVFDYAIKQAREEKNKRILILVPDQFTMQTQMDLVKLSPNNGIMNIEVLSFSRLAHRIFEETGALKKAILDDTGKNLILRKCAERVKDEIPYLSGKLDKPGYIHEVKSAISEFMQYGIDYDGVLKLCDFAKDNNRRTLNNKLSDLSILYKDFLSYIKEKYITTEEAMDILAIEILKSELMRDSLIILDGFTGFTPIQKNVIVSMLKVSLKVIITFTMRDRAMLERVKENDLFYLTNQSYYSLLELAKENDFIVEDSILLENVYRFGLNQDLAYLEKNLFSYKNEKYGDECKNIYIKGYKNTIEEVEALVRNIRELVKNNQTDKKGIAYRDIAVISGNLSAYSMEIQDRCKEYDIPVYIDENKPIMQNPFVEYIVSALNIYLRAFSYEAVFRFLKTDFTCLTKEEVDILDNYIVETGIKGKRAYFSVFSKKTRAMRTEDKNSNRANDLEYINEIRKKFTEELEELEGVCNLKTATAGQIVKSIYNFIKKNNAKSKLDSYAEAFNAALDFAREKEYSQIYTASCKLLEEIYNLVGDEVMNLKEFIGILEAGFSELEIGMIPKSLDRVIVGDMERTRLKSVKYLFFLGLNDGWVPRSAAKGGIISDADREILMDCGMELAPSPRYKMYIGRFYLYANLTKPSEGLFLSYLAMDNEGMAMRPSYIVNNIGNLFNFAPSESIYTDDLKNIQTLSEAKRLYASLIRQYSEGNLSIEKNNDMLALTEYFDSEEKYREEIICNAFFKYEGSSLDERIAGVLYGAKMYASISRMESYAKCAYSYFLKYGMGLKEREEYGIEASDMGNIYHGVLELFIEMLKDRGLDWFSFDEDTARELIDEATKKEAAKYTDAILFESMSNRYIIERMKSVMLRTVMTLSYQLKKSSFKPIEHEFVFSKERSLGVINLGLNREEKLLITGKIDRLDVCETDDKMYVKVVDYKSGEKDFSLMSFYHGLQLQMVVYMNEAAKIMQKKSNKEVTPAALLYYHIDDPIVSATDGDSDEEIERKIIKELRTKGLVSCDDDILIKLDNSFDTSSDVIPVSRKKSGEFDSYAKIIEPDNMKLLTKYADHKINELAKQIIKGQISMNPLELKKSEKSVEINSCEYCDYKKICKFDESLPGYAITSHAKKSDEEILSLIKSEISGEEQ